MKLLHKSIDEINRLGNYPRIDVLESATGPRVVIDGQEFLLFSSNNYLNFANNARLKKAAIDAIEEYGVGSSSSRIVSGTNKLHVQLENEIAEFKEKEDAIVMTSGYSANISMIPVLANSFSIYGKKINTKTVIFFDALSHASILDGIKLSGVKAVRYKHCDIKHLEHLLAKYEDSRKLIITDTIFSMDGDIAPLDKIVELKKKYGALILIDEAHATGTIGNCGRGVANFYKVTDEIDIIMGTFSKAVGSIGAYITSNKDIIKLLRVAIRGNVFSTALPPGDIAVSLEAIKMMRNSSGMVDKLHSKADYLRSNLHKIGYSTMNSQTQIVPIMIGDFMKALSFQYELRKRKIIAPCIQWPAVARDMSRIRFSLNTLHTQEDIDILVSACDEIKKEDI